MIKAQRPLRLIFLLFLPADYFQFS